MAVGHSLSWAKNFALTTVQEDCQRQREAELISTDQLFLADVQIYRIELLLLIDFDKLFVVVRVRAHITHHHICPDIL